MKTLDSEEDQLFHEDRGYPCWGEGGPQQQADRPAVASLQPPFQERKVQSLERGMRGLALQGNREEIRESVSRDA
jgi:hypothetical protein